MTARQQTGKSAGFPMTKPLPGQLGLFSQQSVQAAARDADEANRQAAQRNEDRPDPCAWGECREPSVREHKGERYCRRHIHWAIFT